MEVMVATSSGIADSAGFARIEGPERADTVHGILPGQGRLELLVRPRIRCGFDAEQSSGACALGKAGVTAEDTGNAV